MTCMPACDDASLLLEPATTADRRRVMRVRAPAGMAHFVHYNWFWLDRSLRDPAIRFGLARLLPRRALVGVVAYGPFEPVDQDPASRIAQIGEIYHLVVDRARAGQGLGRRIARRALAALRAELPAITAVRVGHHPANAASARLFAALGFTPIGEKVDHETGTRDVLRELDLGPPGHPSRSIP
jgi:RimJ/RimL family protein N-acetyltransferase